MTITPIPPAEAARAATRARDAVAAQYPSQAVMRAVERDQADNSKAAATLSQSQGLRKFIEMYLEMHRHTEGVARAVLPEVQKIAPVVESLRQSMLVSEDFLRRSQGTMQVLAQVLSAVADAKSRQTGNAVPDAGEQVQEWVETLAADPQFVALTDEAADEATDDEIRAEVVALGLSDEDWVELDMRQLRRYLAFLTVIYLLAQYIKHPMLKQAVNEVISVAGWAGWMFTIIAGKSDK